jgi:hypothetical protein
MTSTPSNRNLRVHDGLNCKPIATKFSNGKTIDGFICPDNTYVPLNSNNDVLSFLDAYDRYEDALEDDELRRSAE